MPRRPRTSSVRQGIAERRQGPQGLEVLVVFARAPLERRRVLHADEDLGPRPGVGATVHVAAARPDLLLQVAAPILRRLEAALPRVGIAQEPGQLRAVPAPAPRSASAPMIRRGPRRGRR